MGLPVVDNVNDIVIRLFGGTITVEDKSPRGTSGTILLIDAPAQLIKQIYFVGRLASLFRGFEIIRIMQIRHFSASV